MFYLYLKVAAMAVVGFAAWHAEHAAEGRVGGVAEGGLLDVVGLGGLGWGFGWCGGEEGGREGALRLVLWN